MTSRRHPQKFLLLSLFGVYLISLCHYITGDEACHVEDGGTTCATKDYNDDDDGGEYGLTDPALKKMIFDIGEGEQIFMAYVQPDVSTFYREPEGTRQEKKPRFKGFAGKFYNLSPFSLVLAWDDGRGNGRPIGQAAPFQAVGTATFPQHLFYFHPPDDDSNELIRFVMDPSTTHYVYDPYDGNVVESPWDVDTLNPDERPLYERQKRTLLFAQKYREFTGRDYQSLYPRNVPLHKIWPAQYFGQQHWVETKETHFVALPSPEELAKITQRGIARRLSPKQPPLLSSYRTPDTPTLNLTLTTLSVSPRVFSIPNFLSPLEVQHILHLATGMSLSRSTVGQSSSGQSADTRTSRNTWVYREHTPIVDAIYRRAADLLRIDEALLRHRSQEELPEWASKSTIAEALQLVHYDPGQQYTAHHDWGYPDVKNGYQPARFATVLLYLNEGMRGGETSFPRWVNAHTEDELKVAPKEGQAVLFYSLLPDGNMDDLSQHAALPVIEGEKWLMNLWVWEPIYS